MRYMLLFLIGCCTFQSYSQANSDAYFNIKVHFDDSIPVLDVQPYYYMKSGNSMYHITYEKDTTDNSITLFGRNDFILIVSFPTLAFEITKVVTLPYSDQKVEKTSSFYLISSRALASYTGEQNKKIEFSYEASTLVASLDKHNPEHSFDKLEIIKHRTYPGNYQELPLSCDKIKINGQFMKIRDSRTE